MRAASSLMLLGSITLFALLAGSVLLQYALPSPKWTLAGQLSDFPAREAPYEIRTERVIFVVNTGSELLALDNHTPRVPGCWVAWLQERSSLMDPCLATRFDHVGRYIDGPLSPPLRRYPVRLEGSQVWIDLSKPIGTTPAP